MKVLKICSVLSIVIVANASAQVIDEAKKIADRLDAPTISGSFGGANHGPLGHGMISTGLTLSPGSLPADHLRVEGGIGLGVGAPGLYLPLEFRLKAMGIKEGEGFADGHQYNVNLGAIDINRVDIPGRSVVKLINPELQYHFSKEFGVTAGLSLATSAGGTGLGLSTQLDYSPKNSQNRYYGRIESLPGVRIAELGAHLDWLGQDPLQLAIKSVNSSIHVAKAVDAPFSKVSLEGRVPLSVISGSAR